MSKTSYECAQNEMRMNELILSYPFVSGQVLEIAQGDITRENTDAIVNAANNRLQHGAGVAGAILQRGGYKIQEESDAWVRKYGPVSHDKPAYTSGGFLECRYVIHAVGPVWGEGDEDQKLTAAVRGCLQTAEELRLSSLALPAISTGIFGFPKDRAARIIFETMVAYFEDFPKSGLTRVRITLFDTDSVNLFMREFDAWKSAR